jgi:hypothetical protein
VVDHVDGVVGELEVVVVGVVHIHVGRHGRVHGRRAQRLRVLDLHPGEFDIRQYDVRVPELEDGLIEHHEHNATPCAPSLQLPFPLQPCESPLLGLNLAATFGVHHVQCLCSHSRVRQQSTLLPDVTM